MYMSMKLLHRSLLIVQKLHNVQVALTKLKRYVSLPAGVTAESIADGHREKSLALLWTIIFHFKVHVYKVYLR